MERLNISSGSRFERDYGYSRAVRVGELVFVSGTTGFDYTTGTISDDPAVQFSQIVANMEWALGEAGSGLDDVVQLTVYTSSAEAFEAIGPSLKEAFGDIGPTNTALVTAFPFPDIKVEVSATAIVGSGAG